MSKARPETSTGRRKPTPEQRAKMSAAAKKQWADMTPEKRAAALARIGRGPSPDGKVKAPAAGPVPPPAGGRANPLSMTPRELWRSLRGEGRPASE